MIYRWIRECIPKILQPVILFKIEHYKTEQFAIISPWKSTYAQSESLRCPYHFLKHRIILGFHLLKFPRWTGKNTYNEHHSFCEPRLEFMDQGYISYNAELAGKAHDTWLPTHYFWIPSHHPMKVHVGGRRDANGSSQSIGPAPKRARSGHTFSIVGLGRFSILTSFRPGNLEQSQPWPSLCIYI